MTRLLCSLCTMFLSAGLTFAGEAPVGRFSEVKSPLEPGLGAAWDAAPRVSPNGLRLFFRRSDLRLWCAIREDKQDAFGQPGRLSGPVLGGANWSAALSGDGRTLIFNAIHSDRVGGTDLYAATHLDGKNFSDPFDLCDFYSGVACLCLNTDFNEGGPELASDGTLFFNSTRAGTQDIYEASWSSKSRCFVAVRALYEVNDPFANDVAPSISRDGLWLFFGSNRSGAGAQGGQDIWVARRLSRKDRFGEPVNLNILFPGSAVNTPWNDTGPDIDWDWPDPDSKLYFQSGRGSSNQYWEIFEASWIAVVPPSKRFLRGDCNVDGTVDISDAVFSLGSLFLVDRDPGCDDACDSNDDGAADISDAITTLGVLFLGQGTVPPPGMMECGVDPTDDEVGCETFEMCP